MIAAVPKYPVRMTMLRGPISSNGGRPRATSVRKDAAVPHALHLSSDGVGTSMRHCISNLAMALRDIGIDASASISGPNGDDVWHVGPDIDRSPWISIRWNTDFESNHSMWASRRVVLDVTDTWSWAMGDRVDGLNQHADLLVVPAKSNVHEFKNAGVEIPISVVPFGVDSRVYHPDAPDWSIVETADWNWTPTEGTFLFLVAGMLNERKGVDVALEAFEQAFDPREPVALLVKNSVRDSGTSQIDTVAMKSGRGKVGLIERHLDERSMSRLLSTADCFVNCHHREGFGLMPLQAMACGTIPIITAWDGPLSYANNHNSILVPPSRIVKTTSILGVRDGIDWAELDPSDVARAMQQAYRKDTSEMKRNAIETAASWSWKLSAMAFVKAIEAKISPVRRTDPNPDLGLQV